MIRGSDRPRIAIYTAICGGYDSLKPVSGRWAGDADFVAYVEGVRSTPGWRVRPPCALYADPCRNAKVHKILMGEIAEQYDFSIWVDGAVQVTSNEPVRTLLDAWLREDDVAVFRHRTRNCIYAEADACVAQRKDHADIIQRQIARYRGEGYPANAGLAECTVVVRRHTPRVLAFCRAWHHEIHHHSRRDQLSFNYVARKLGMRYRELPGTIVANEHFTWYLHDHDHGEPQRVR